MPRNFLFRTFSNPDAIWKRIKKYRKRNDHLNIYVQCIYKKIFILYWYLIVFKTKLMQFSVVITNTLQKLLHLRVVLISNIQTIRECSARVKL